MCHFISNCAVVLAFHSVSSVPRPRCPFPCREVAEWSPALVPYGEGAIVQHKGHLFVGLGSFNTAQPGSMAATILFVSSSMTVSLWIMGSALFSDLC